MKIKNILAAVAATLITVNVFAQQIVWKQKASLPVGFGGEAITLNNKIYFIAANSNTTGFYMYDPSIDTWKELTNLPEYRANLALAEIAGKIYAIGGDWFGDTNYEYTPETDTWKALAPMPTKRQHIDCGIVGNEIYVIGGLNSWTTITKKNEVYNAATNTWSEKASIPSLRNNPAIVTVDSLIYVIGGGGSSDNVWKDISTVECYNTKTDTWISKKSLPYALFKPGALMVNNLLFVLGGQKSDVASSSVLWYDLEKNSWKTTTSLPKKNCFAGYTSIGDKLYVIGGTPCTPIDNWLWYSEVYEGTVTDTTDHSSDYFGQIPPGDTAVIFAPGIISQSNRMEHRIVFTPDGNECYFTVSGQENKIYFTKRENNTWSKQEIAPFSTNINASYPFISADGRKLYFNISSPSDWKKTDIGYVERTTEGWSSQQLLSSPVNSDSYDGNYTETDDGVIYLSSNRSNNWNLWCLRRLPDQSLEASNFSSILNFTYDISSATVSHDGSYLIFVSYGTSTNFQKLYISFNKGNNEWTTPMDMEKSGAKINIDNHSQVSPSLSPDGKYLYFSRHNEDGEPFDIYWVSTSIIPTLKKIVFAPKVSIPLPNVSITTDSTLSLEIPENTFVCEYGTDNLTYSATLKNGDALPSWLTFNDSTRTFSGKPVQAETDTIAITATNADSVSATCTFIITVETKTGMIRPERQNIKIFPNPTSGLFSISLGTMPQKTVQAEIYTTEGRLILTKEFRNTTEATVDLSTYPDGMYLIKFFYEGFNYEEKIIKSTAL